MSATKLIVTVNSCRLSTFVSGLEGEIKPTFCLQFLQLFADRIRRSSRFWEPCFNSRFWGGEWELGDAKSHRADSLENRICRRASSQVGGSLAWEPEGRLVGWGRLPESQYSPRGAVRPQYQGKEVHEFKDQGRLCGMGLESGYWWGGEVCLNHSMVR